MGLKDFQVISKLGEGAFSSVWKVKRISDGQEYAMKKVKMMALSEKERQNALNEVRILASIRNPYIIGYKEAFFEDTANTLCIVMEHAGGGDLYKMIEKHQKSRTTIKEQDIWNYAIQMIIGLKGLHDMKILHRDLKSANVFISGDGKTVRLGDLNVSKVAKSELVYTQTGTPYYASPEVWKDKPYDSKSDIWSLGCVLYELATLKPPFRANDMQGLFRKIQKGVYDKLPANYSSDLSDFIGVCLQVNPALRPNCDKLLNHPLIIKNCREFRQSFEALEEENELLGTIKLPRNIKAIGNNLPKANYSDEIKSLDLDKGAFIKIEDSERPLYSRRAQRAYSQHAPGIPPQEKIAVPKPVSRQINYVPSKPVITSNDESNLVERVKPVRVRIEQVEKPYKPAPLINKTPQNAANVAMINDLQRPVSNQVAQVRKVPSRVIDDENVDPNARRRNVVAPPLEIKRQPNPVAVVNRHAVPQDRYSHARAIDMINGSRDEAIAKRAENIVRRYYADAALADKREPLAEIKKVNTPVANVRDAIDILDKYERLPNVREPKRTPLGIMNQDRYESAQMRINAQTPGYSQNHVNVIRNQEIQGRGVIRPSWWG